MYNLPWLITSSDSLETLTITQFGQSVYRIKWKMKSDTGNLSVPSLLKLLLPGLYVGSSVNVENKKALYSIVYQSSKGALWSIHQEEPEEAMLYPVFHVFSFDEMNIKAFSIVNQIDAEVFEQLKLPKPHKIFELMVSKEGGFIRGYSCAEEDSLAYVSIKNGSEGFTLYQVPYPDESIDGSVFTQRKSGYGWVQFYEQITKNGKLLEGAPSKIFGDAKDLQAYLLSEDLEEYQVPYGEEKHELFWNCPREMKDVAISVLHFAIGLKQISKKQNEDLTSMLFALNDLPSIPSDSYNFTICSENNYAWYSIQLSEESFSLFGRFGEVTTQSWEISQEVIIYHEGSLFEFSDNAINLMENGAKILTSGDEDE